MHSNGTLTIRIRIGTLRQSANTLYLHKEMSCFLWISGVHLRIIQMLPFQRKWCRNYVEVWADINFCQDFSCIGNSKVPQGFKSSSGFSVNTCLLLYRDDKHCFEAFHIFVHCFVLHLSYNDYMALVWMGSDIPKNRHARGIQSMLCFIEACKCFYLWLQMYSYLWLHVARATCNVSYLAL